jgi:uncharacterized protein CbrC (UPF0167 family)
VHYHALQRTLAEVRAAHTLVSSCHHERMIKGELPEFPYHPDPIATGSVVGKPLLCSCCGQQRTMTYVGPVFAEEELEDELCPWCIADGTAADTYDAQFTDVTWRVPDDVSAEVTEVVLRRTPGFNGWQQERWLHHCGDGAEFHGRVGAKELRTLPDARAVLLADMGRYGWSAAQLERFVESLDAGGSATAYLFRCRHCRTHLAYADFT